MQKIHIKNFGPIKDAEIEIKDVLLFIGEQASGKSIISKLIYFFKSLRADMLNVLDENIDVERDLSSAFMATIRNKFYKFFGSTKYLPDFEIKYNYSENKYIQLSLHHLEESLKIHICEDFYTKILTEAKYLMKERQNMTGTIVAYNVTFRPSNVEQLLRLTTRWNDVFDDDRIPLFIPAGRNVTVTYTEQFKLNFYGELTGLISRIESENLSISGPKNRREKDQSVDMYLMIEFLRKVEGLKDRFKGKDFRTLVENEHEIGNDIKNGTLLDIVQEKIKTILKGEYRHDEYGEKIFYHPKEKHYIYLNNASSGQQEVIRILQDIFLVLLDQENVFRVIEEPEAHLYPVAQKYLLEIIALMINATKSQVLITTHSPYILSIFNNLLFASKVVNANETVKKDVKEVIEESVWIDASKCQAYALKGGKCHSILDPKTGLIGENYLDEISEELGANFDELYHLHKRTFE